MKKKFLTAIYIFIIFALMSGMACLSLAADFPDPTPEFFVNDFAGVIDSRTEDEIQNAAVQLYERTGAQVVVVTIDSLGGEPLEIYAVKLFREWGIGEADKNNGVIILVAIEDRMSRIEVGYGLEGALPDGKTGRIQDNYMIPAFKEGNYSEGILVGFLAIVREVYNEYGIEADTGYERYYYSEQENDADTRNIIYIFIIIAVLILDWIFFKGRLTRFFVYSSMFRRGGGGGFSGGGRSGRGGGFSGGGGRSGGGGSSRRW
jgi:uncharacterized protein